MTPDVSVVIPYYDDPPGLRVLLAALDQQHGAPDFEVVIADDGSPTAPEVPTDLRYRCTVVRQPDLGFRAAAARNLGAAASTGKILVFLDADTLPTAGYLAAVAAAVPQTDTGHGALVVGRRRHLDRGDATDEQLLAMLRRPDLDPTAPLTVLDDPAWLIDGYRRTADLTRSGDEDFRLVISAVLAVDRRLWTRLGGFDETFIGYGGEDWDLAWRAWTAGADRRYVPAALAWHDGPDAAGRGIDVRDKNVESLRLAATIPLPSTRGHGPIHRIPAVVVRYLGDTTGTAEDAAVVVAVAEWLHSTDAAVWFPGCRDRTTLPPLLRSDPRVHPGDCPADITARAFRFVELHRPFRLPVPAAEFSAEDREVPGWCRVQHARAHHRGQATVQRSAAETGLQPIPADLSLEREWGGW